MTHEEIRHDREQGMTDYDAGPLNDFGGGDVNWWFDYLRAEIGRSNDYWRDAYLTQTDEIERLRARVAELEAAMRYGIESALNELTARNLPLEWSRDSGIWTMIRALGMNSPKFDAELAAALKGADND